MPSSLDALAAATGRLVESSGAVDTAWRTHADGALVTLAWALARSGHRELALAVRDAVESPALHYAAWALSDGTPPERAFPAGGLDPVDAAFCRAMYALRDPRAPDEAELRDFEDASSDLAPFLGDLDSGFATLSGALVYEGAKRGDVESVHSLLDDLMTVEAEEVARFVGSLVSRHLVGPEAALPMLTWLDEYSALDLVSALLVSGAPLSEATVARSIQLLEDSGESPGELAELLDIAGRTDESDEIAEELDPRDPRDAMPMVRRAARREEIREVTRRATPLDLQVFDGPAVQGLFCIGGEPALDALRMRTSPWVATVALAHGRPWGKTMLERIDRLDLVTGLEVGQELVRIGETDALTLLADRVEVGGEQVHDLVRYADGSFDEHVEASTLTSLESSVAVIRTALEVTPGLDPHGHMQIRRR